MDRISHLPDEILGYILSFLPTKQAASTSLLSKRWRNVFLLVSTLDFDYKFESRRSLHEDYNQRKFMDFVESLLSRQGKSLMKKVTLKIYDLEPTRVQSWIRNVLERGVVDLNLSSIKNRHWLSSLIFENNTLVKLTLGGGFQSILSQDFYLPKLKTLCIDLLVHVDVFENLLHRCPVLEELVIQSWVEGSSSFVSSRSLKKLTIRLSISVETISFDVPNLVYLELSCYFRVKLYNVNLDSLVEFRLKHLREGSAYSIPVEVSDIIIQMRNVRVLHVTSGDLERFYFSGQELPRFDNLVRLCIASEKKRGWQILPLLIKNSPNLETLIFKGLKHYKTTNCGDVCVCTGSKEENSSSCLSSCRIKVLEIWNRYKRSSKELNQIKHFLKMLPCLELVKIKVANNVNVPKYVQKLLELPRASLNCKIQAIC